MINLENKEIIEGLDNYVLQDPDYISELDELDSYQYPQVVSLDILNFIREKVRKQLETNGPSFNDFNQIYQCEDGERFKLFVEKGLGSLDYSFQNRKLFIHKIDSYFIKGLGSYFLKALLFLAKQHNVSKVGGNFNVYSFNLFINFFGKENLSFFYEYDKMDFQKANQCVKKHHIEVFADVSDIPFSEDVCIEFMQ